jgi:tRNA A37 threonylcarbamoyladenosine synthetase subunit TsaC/SUA5/YrdC
VPAHLPLLRILVQMNMPLASTSANLHGQAVLTREEDVLDFFDGKVEYILTDGTLSPLASTVLDATCLPYTVLRAGSIDPEELRCVYEDVEDYL